MPVSKSLKKICDSGLDAESGRPQRSRFPKETGGRGLRLEKYFVKRQMRFSERFEDIANGYMGSEKGMTYFLAAIINPV